MVRNGTTRVSKPSKPKSKKKIGKILKDSAGKLRRSLDVFTNKNHENQYTSLKELQEPQAQNITDSDDSVIVLDESEEETSSSGEKIKSSGKINSTNDLANNEDYISLNFSDSDEEAEGEENELLSNEDDAYSIDEYDTRIDNGIKVKSDVPWVQNHDHSTQKEIADWLTMEIKDFVAYISPSKDEIELRNSTVRRLRESIMRFWVDCEVHVFGSYATDLYLPGSDIDMVIISDEQKYENRNSLYSLSSYLKREGLAERVEVIAKAKVPIIKFVEIHSNIHIDVSFERTNGISAAKTIRGWLDDTPCLRELVLIVKQFLNARRMNDVHTGGLGGYSIICLTYSFLVLHPRLSTGNIDAIENLGVLLIEFFELYGRNFGYENVAICVDQDNVCYLNKSYFPSLQGRNPMNLAIRDPDDASNNISRSSYNIVNIKKAFTGAYELLTNKCYELEHATYKERIGRSILGNIIKYKGSERNFEDERDLVINEAIHGDTQSTYSTNGQKVYFSEHDETSDESDYDANDDQQVSHDSGETPRYQSNRERVDDYMNLDKDDDDSSTEEGITRTKSIDRDARREYWLQKGNRLS